MKNLLLLLALCICQSFPALAQTIPNQGFETWMDGNPVDWWTNNIPGLLVPITQTSNAHEGSSALMGTVLEFGGNEYTPIIGGGIDGLGFPINSRPEALHGWYIFQSDSGDNFSANVVLTLDQQAVGAGILYSPTNYPVYTEFVVNIMYSLPDIPDTVQILFLISNSPRVHIGSTFTIDDLAFGSATDVGMDPLPDYAFVLEQNYPNPFNPSTIIPFEIAVEGDVVLKVFDLLGQEVATLVNQRMARGRYRAEFDASNHPAGMYVYRLEMGGRTETRKMVVLK